MVAQKFGPSMMPFQGFEGPAGTGKTYRLIEEVQKHLITTPLASHQRVLALTFMHGSRKRLDRRFAEIPTLRNKTVCMTIDSFAQSIFQRWATLAAEKGIISAEGFNEICNACGELLEEQNVAAWVSQTFPLVVVDEAQELKPERLRILKALAPYVSLYVAADEFQCLDETVDTAPFLEWFETGQVEALTIVHRTNRQGLLNAGIALRAMQTPFPKDGLYIAYKYPNEMPYAIVSSLHRTKGSKVLIYAPSGRDWADKIINKAALGMQSKSYGQIPSIRLIHEDKSQEEKKSILALFEKGKAHSADDICTALDDIEPAPLWLASVRLAIIRMFRTQGLYVWSRDDLIKLVERKAALHRAFGYHRIPGIPVMSIHQAKNRQFDHVVILWPPGVPGSDEWKARLLYNGITRAVNSCKVFIRIRDLLKQPPFFFIDDG